jgi:RNA polymerase sigma factor for flagellar operon FliA
MSDRTAVLDAGRRDLAGAHVALARRIAGRLTAAIPYLRDDAESAALEGLCAAAAGFDPSRGLKFAAYALPRIRGAVLDLMRDSGLKGYRRHPGDAPGVYSLDEVAAASPEGLPAAWHEVLAGDDAPPDEQAEADDRIDALLRHLPRPHRRVMDLLYHRADTITMKAAGRAAGLSESRVSKIHSEAIEIIQQTLGVTSMSEANGHAAAPVMTVADPLTSALRRAAEVAREIADEGRDPTDEAVSERSGKSLQTIRIYRQKTTRLDPSLWPGSSSSGTVRRARPVSSDASTAPIALPAASPTPAVAGGIAAELAAMAEVHRIASGLDPRTARRVLQWAADRIEEGGVPPG